MLYIHHKIGRVILLVFDKIICYLFGFFKCIIGSIAVKYDFSDDTKFISILLKL